MDRLPDNVQRHIFSYLTDIRSKLSVESVDHHRRTLLAESQWESLNSLIVKVTTNANGPLRFGSFRTRRGGGGRDLSGNIDGLETKLRRMYGNNSGSSSILDELCGVSSGSGTSSRFGIKKSSGSGGGSGGGGSGSNSPKNAVKSLKGCIGWHLERCPDLNTLVVDLSAAGGMDKDTLDNVLGVLNNPKSFGYRLKRIHIRRFKTPTASMIVPFIRYNSNVTISLFVDDQPIAVSKHFDLLSRLDAVEPFASIHLRINLPNSNQSRSIVFAARVADNLLYCRQTCKKVDEDNLLDGFRRFHGDDLRHFQLSISPLPISSIFKSDYVPFLGTIQSLEAEAHGYFQLPSPRLLFLRCPRLVRLKLDVAEESSQAISPISAIIKEYLNLPIRMLERNALLIDVNSYLVIGDNFGQLGTLLPPETYQIEMIQMKTGEQSSTSSLREMPCTTSSSPSNNNTTLDSPNRSSSVQQQDGSSRISKRSLLHPGGAGIQQGVVGGVGGVVADGRLSISETSLLANRIDRKSEPSCCLAVRLRPPPPLSATSSASASTLTPTTSAANVTTDSPRKQQSELLNNEASENRSDMMKKYRIVHVIFRAGLRRNSAAAGGGLTGGGKYQQNPRLSYGGGAESRRMSSAVEDMRRIRQNRDRFRSSQHQPKSMEGAEFFAPLPRLGPEMEVQQFGIFTTLRVPENHFSLQWEKY